MTKDHVITWRPQKGPQEAFIKCPVEEIMFGGARGGGKSDASIARCMLRAIKYGKDYKAIFIRRELTQLEPAISRSIELYSPFATFNHARKKWTFSNGAEVMFRYIERDSDAEKLQGSSVTDLCIEEAGNFPDPAPLMKLKGILRSVAGVPTSLVLTSNPGGPGHYWVKSRYVDPNPMGWEIIKESDPMTGLVSERIYIPSRITDNLLLLKNDPSYLSRLAQTGSPALVRAWIEGDFSQVDGAFFEEFSIDTHVIAPCELPKHWLRFRCADWGSYYPFAVLWVAYVGEEWKTPQGRAIPKGSLIFYRELYGADEAKNNRGLKMDAESVGRLIAHHDGKDKIAYGVLDPKAFDQDRGPSIAERMARETAGKVRFRRADNRRTAREGSIGGWDALRTRLRGINGIPTVYFFSTCKNLIRTFPLAQHDPDKPEDLSLPEAHLLDAARYGCMSRPWGASAPEPERNRRDIYTSTFQDLLNDKERKLKRRRHEPV